MKPQIAAAAPSFEAMYDRHFRHVLAYCGRRVPSADAADAAADTFLVAWRRFADMPVGDGERPWLYGVAYKVVSNHRRSAVRRGRLIERVKSTRRTADNDTAVQVVRSESDREVLEAIARLDEIDQEVILLTLWEELPAPQVAAALGISEAAVRKRKSRARRRLQRILQPREEHAVVIPITEAEGDAP